MGVPEVDAVLARCQTPEQGCFAGNADALNAMLFMDDIVLRKNWERVAGAADDAASADTSLEDASYTSVVIRAASDGGFGHELVDGPEVSLGDLERGAENTTASVAYDVAHAAYVYGRNAQNCPIKNPATQ